MVKILIVDDNNNNRMILQLLLEDYMNENSGIKFNIKSAENGKIALDMAISEQFDLIFMDIMMPIMNGIDATKKIREINKDVMIIAVSAVDDIESQKIILFNGAEDYIPKPLNADLFQRRLENYLALLHARNNDYINKESVNLFSNHIYSRNTTFIIDSEETLSEFWEYFLLKDNFKCDGLSDVVRTIFSLGTFYIKKFKDSTKIVLEESNQSLYLTLLNVDQLTKRVIDAIIEKESVKSEYKLDNNKLSFNLSMGVSKKEVIPVVLENNREKNYSKNNVFDYMSIYDLDDIYNSIRKIKIVLNDIGSNRAKNDDILKISTYINQIAMSMQAYEESATVGREILKLVNTIDLDRKNFLHNMNKIQKFGEQFLQNIITWARMVFEEGAPSYDFMDKAIIDNIDEIITTLQNSSSEKLAKNDSRSVDDIFDF